MLKNKNGFAFAFVLIGVVVGLFAAFVGNLKEKADNHNANTEQR